VVHSFLVTIAGTHALARKRMFAAINTAALFVYVVAVMTVVKDVLVTSRTNAKSRTIRLMCATIVRIVEIVLKTDICTLQN